jgi:hypothetical protein
MEFALPDPTRARPDPTNQNPWSRLALERALQQPAQIDAGDPIITRSWEGRSWGVTITQQDHNDFKDAFNALRIAFGCEKAEFNFFTMEVTFINQHNLLEKKNLSEYVGKGKRIHKGNFECIKKMQEIFKKYSPKTEIKVIKDYAELKECCSMKSFSSVPGMQLSHPTLQKLEAYSTYSDCATHVMDVVLSKVEKTPVQKENSLKRIAVVESYLNRLEPIINNKLAALRQELNDEKEGLEGADPNAYDERQGIAAEIKEIEKSIGDLEKQAKFNRLALYTVVALLPDTDNFRAAQQSAVIEQAANDIYETLHDMFVNEGVRTWLPEGAPELLRGAPTHAAEIREYCADVAALAFSLLPADQARTAADAFWTKHDFRAKMHTIDDEILRAISSGANAFEINKFPLAQAIQTSVGNVDIANAFTSASGIANRILANTVIENNRGLFPVPHNIKPTNSDKIAHVRDILGFGAAADPAAPAVAPRHGAHRSTVPIGQLPPRKPKLPPLKPRLNGQQSPLANPPNRVINPVNEQEMSSLSQSDSDTEISF